MRFSFNLTIIYHIFLLLLPSLYFNIRPLSTTMDYVWKVDFGKSDVISRPPVSGGSRLINCSRSAPA